MKAIAKVVRGKGLEMIECPCPKPRTDEVLIRVDVASICGTDLHIDRWDGWAEKRIKSLPRIIGHEFAGKVVDIGKDVNDIQVGDSVTSDSHLPCLTCGICLRGLPHLCGNLEILGIDREGCFSEYVTIPERSLWKNDPELSLEIASIQDPLGNAVYATLVESVKGDTVAIFGDGPIGLFSVGVARAAGAKKVILTGMNPLTLDIARRMGADRTYHFEKENVTKMIQSETEGLGADVLLEMSGNPMAIQEGLSALRKGGRFSAFGLPSAPVPVDFNQQIIFKGIRIYGVSGRRMFETWRKMSDLLKEGRLDPGLVITHRLDFEDFKEGFQMMEAVPRQAAKVILILNRDL